MKFAEGGGGFNFDEGSWNNLKVGNIPNKMCQNQNLLKTNKIIFHLIFFI